MDFRFRGQGRTKIDGKIEKQWNHREAYFTYVNTILERADISFLLNFPSVLFD